MPLPEYRVEVQRIEEVVEDGLRRLGAHFEKDSRSKNYPIREWIDRAEAAGGGSYQTDPTKLQSRSWPRNVPILDQGALGSCVGNAGAGMIGSGATTAAIQARMKHLTVSEMLATNIYERATRLDGLGQPFYPPEDRGSTTLGGLKALASMGLIDEYRWAFGLTDLLNMISLVGPCMVGVLWYTSFDEPQPDGELKISSGATVRGGHELELREIDVERRLVWGDNSWGPDWDVKGDFAWSWDTLGQLLESDQGEAGIGLLVSSPLPSSGQ